MASVKKSEIKHLEAQPPRTFGYARVSTDEQNSDLQLTALRNAGCDEIFEDRISGRTTSRPALDRLLPQLRRGDTLAVWKLDRLGRRVVHLVGLMEELRLDGIEFRSLTEGMDTRTVMGRAMFQLVAVFAEMERGQMHERITAGISAAKAAGVHCGRRRSLTPVHVDDARTKILAGWSSARTAAFHGVSRTTLYDAIRRDDLAKAAVQSGLMPVRRTRGRPRTSDARTTTERQSTQANTTTSGKPNDTAMAAQPPSFSEGNPFEKPVANSNDIFSAAPVPPNPTLRVHRS